MLIGVGVVVLLAAGATGWWLLTRGEQVFPNAVEPVSESIIFCFVSS
jgi:hypothetical protein